MIGLVTVLYKSDEVLPGFFESISIQNFQDYFIYIIDNDTNPVTAALVKSLTEKYQIKNYTYLPSDKNEGIAKGNNIGIEMALKQQCTHVLLLNNDIEFYQPSLLAEMVNCSISENEPIIIPKIYYYGTKKIWVAGGSFVKYKGIIEHYGDGQNGDEARFNKPIHCSYAPTCFMLIRKSVFEKIGFMDEKYFVYYDDTDFMYRAYIAGFSIYYMPQLEVYHKVSSSTGKGSLFTIYYCNRNRIYFIKKNFSLFYKTIALTTTIATRCVQYFLYNGEKRKTMVNAVKDGFAMQHH